MHVSKVINVPIIINGHKTAAQFYFVENLHVDFIFGIDWRSENGAQICFRTNKLLLKKRRLLYAKQEVLVPSYSEHVLVARIIGEELPRSFTGISCGIKCHTSPLLFSKSLDVIENINTRVRCLNIIDRPVIKRNKNLGQFKCLKFDDQLKSFDLKESINEKPNKTPFKPSEQVLIDDKEPNTDVYKLNPSNKK